MILGLDLSSTATGVCLDGVARVFKPDAKGDLIARARDIADHLNDEYRLADIDLVVVEAIGTRMVNAAIALATVHAVVIDTIRYDNRWRVPVVTVPPAALKKFATGRGNADKVQMAMAAQRCGYSGPENDNAIDAWWLWAIGAYDPYGQTSSVPATVARAAVVDSLNWPVVA